MSEEQAGPDSGSEPDVDQDPGAPAPAAAAPAPPGQGTDDDSPEPVEGSQGVIGDDQLPDDLRPTADNPLAQPLPDGERSDLELPEPDPEGGSDEAGESGDRHPDED